MAKADAWGATGGSFHARRTAVKRASAGLMGNARLIAEPAYRRLLAAGVSAADINRIAAPIGLAIGAASPAEIAVAILAQAIAAFRLRGAAA